MIEETEMNKNELHSFIVKHQPNICQIVGYVKGTEVYSGEWNEFKKHDTCHVMSVTKSIVSLLIGIVIDQGLIQSVDQPVLSFSQIIGSNGGKRRFKMLRFAICSP